MAVSENVLEVLREASFADYVDAHGKALVCGTPKDEDIIMQVAGEEPTVEDRNDEEDKETPARRSALQFMEALNIVHIFSYEEGEDTFRNIRTLEYELMKVALQDEKVMPDFFHE